jgi:hypothetical protein
MKPELIIQALIEVVKNKDFVFSPQAVEDLPNLKTKISELENAPGDQIKEAIRQWMINHKDVTDAVLGLTQREIRDDLKPSKDTDAEGTLQNKCRILQKEIEKLEERNKRNKKVN